MTLHSKKRVGAIDLNEFMNNAHALNMRAQQHKKLLEERIRISENEFRLTAHYPNGNVAILADEDATGKKNGIYAEFNTTNTKVTKFGYYEPDGKFDPAELQDINHAKVIKNLLG